MREINSVNQKLQAPEETIDQVIRQSQSRVCITHAEKRANMLDHGQTLVPVRTIQPGQQMCIQYPPQRGVAVAGGFFRWPLQRREILMMSVPQDRINVQVYTCYFATAFLYKCL